MKKSIIVTFGLLLSLNAFANWKLVHQEDEIKIYSGDKHESGVIPFRAEGTIHADISTVSNVLLNYKKKPLWSPKLKKVIIHKRLKNNEFIFSEFYSTPWPSTDREFLLKGKIIHHNNGDIEYIGQSINSNYKNDDHIQTDVKTLSIKLKKMVNLKTHITFVFHGDMKGWMPVWLMNLIQKKWPLRFIQGLRKEASLNGDKLISLN